MLTKDDIVQQLTTIASASGVPLDELTVISSGTFVMLGKKEHAGDIDVVTSEENFNKIVKVFPEGKCRKQVPVKGVEVTFDSVQVKDAEIAYVTASEICNDTVVTNGVRHMTIEAAVAFKKSLGREKDFIHLREMGLL